MSRTPLRMALALALAAVGWAAYGFLVGPVAVVMGLRARRLLPAGKGRGRAGLAVVLGALEALAWLAALLLKWHPRQF